METTPIVRIDSLKKVRDYNELIFNRIIDIISNRYKALCFYNNIISNNVNINIITNNINQSKLIEHKQVVLTDDQIDEMVISEFKQFVNKDVLKTLKQNYVSVSFNEFKYFGSWFRLPDEILKQVFYIACSIFVLKRDGRNGNTFNKETNTLIIKDLSIDYKAIRLKSLKTEDSEYSEDSEDPEAIKVKEL